MRVRSGSMQEEMEVSHRAVTLCFTMNAIPSTFQILGLRGEL